MSGLFINLFSFFEDIFFNMFIVQIVADFASQVIWFTLCRIVDNVVQNKFSHVNTDWINWFLIIIWKWEPDAS